MGAEGCGCQGSGLTGGISVTVGCSFQSRCGGCKFGNSRYNPASGKIRRFALANAGILQEVRFEAEVTRLASLVGDLTAKMVPEAHTSMVAGGDNECRVGLGQSRPFTGATFVLDFTAHSHK
jgi:Oxygenase domain of the 2OGFeDO superfamily